VAKYINTKLKAWINNPLSQLPSNAASIIPHHKCHYNLICHLQNLISNVSALHKQHTHTVKHDIHWLSYQEQIKYSHVALSSFLYHAR
jgi:hypothetical protein